MVRGLWDACCVTPWWVNYAHLSSTYLLEDRLLLDFHVWNATERNITKSFLFFSKLQAPWKLWLFLATSHELAIFWSTLEIIQRKKRSDLNSSERCFEEGAPVINTGEVLPSPEATDLTAGVTWSKYKVLGPLHLAYVVLGCAKETGIQSLWDNLSLASVSSVTSNKPAKVTPCILCILLKEPTLNTPKFPWRIFGFRSNYKLFCLKRHNFSTKLTWLYTQNQCQSWENRGNHLHFQTRADLHKPKTLEQRAVGYSKS